MDRRSVSSSNIRAIGYDAESNVLEIEFHSGWTYHYFEVPSGRYQSLMDATSKGSFFNREIKGKYSYERIR